MSDALTSRSQPSSDNLPSSSELNTSENPASGALGQLPSAPYVLVAGRTVAEELLDHAVAPALHLTVEPQRDADQVADSDTDDENADVRTLTDTKHRELKPDTEPQKDD